MDVVIGGERVPRANILSYRAVETPNGRRRHTTRISDAEA